MGHTLSFWKACLCNMFVIYWWYFYRKYLEDACIWVESNATTLSILSSQAEIGLGFLLIISLLSSVLLVSFHYTFTSIHVFCHSFSKKTSITCCDTFLLTANFICRWQRNIIQTFMYWQVITLILFLIFYPLLGLKFFQLLVNCS